MKAVMCTKYGSPEVLKLVDVEKPLPKENEVLIKVYASTVTVADFRIRSFTIPLSFWIPAKFILGFRKPKNSILGMELSGVIDSVGNGVKKFKSGDMVFASSIENFGAYAEYKCLSEDSLIARKPLNISFGETATLPIGGLTALNFLRRANIQAGQKVLIYGASGSVGTYAVQLAKYFGAVVTGVCSSKNVDLVRSIGADKVIDYSSHDFLMQLEQYDVIFMAVDKWSFNVASNYLKENGVLINISMPLKSLTMLWKELTGKIKILVGKIKNNPGDLNFLAELVEKRLIYPVIDRRYAIQDIVEAHKYVDQGHKKGNVIIDVLDN